MNRGSWSATEDEYLHELIGDYPPDLLVSFYNRWASLHGFRRRTHAAILFRITVRFRASRIPIGRYMKASDLSRHLQVSPEKVGRWAAAGMIPERFLHRSRIGLCVQRNGIRHLAQHHPDKFQALNREDLFLLLEREELADQVHEHNQTAWKFRKPVICLTTGRRYPSITAAAETIPLHPAQFGRLLRAAPVITYLDRQWKIA